MTDINLDELVEKHNIGIIVESDESDLMVGTHVMSRKKLLAFANEYAALLSSELQDENKRLEVKAQNWIDFSKKVQKQVEDKEATNQALVDEVKRLRGGFEKVISKGDYTAPEGMKHIAKQMLDDTPATIKDLIGEQ